MKLLILFFISIVVAVLCKDVFFGSKDERDRRIHRDKVEYNAIPWKKRVKYYFYNNLEGSPIKAILCYDYERTEASVNITAGGIGHTFVNLRLKSQRSYGLDYAIEIYG